MARNGKRLSRRDYSQESGLAGFEMAPINNPADRLYHLVDLCFFTAVAASVTNGAPLEPWPRMKARADELVPARRRWCRRRLRTSDVSPCRRPGQTRPWPKGQCKGRNKERNIWSCRELAEQAIGRRLTADDKFYPIWVRPQSTIPLNFNIRVTPGRPVASLAGTKRTRRGFERCRV